MKNKLNFSTLFIGAICISIFSFPLGRPGWAQNIAINNTGATPNASAMLDVDAGPGNNKGLLIPRVNFLERTGANFNPLPAVAQGLLVYQTGAGGDGEGYYYNTSTTTTPAWVKLFSSTTGWSLTGNAGTSPAINFIGTTDNVSLRFHTNNTEKMIIDSLGNVGIGTTSPNRPLVVSGPWSGDVVRIISSIASQGGLWVQSGTQTGRFEVFPGSPSGISIDAVGGGENNIDFRTANNLRMRILGSGAGAGNVGIGTTGPIFPFEVMSSTAPQVGIAGASNYRASFWVTAGLLNIMSGFDGAANVADIALSVDNNPVGALEVMRIANTGNVGIGTTGPNSKLQVAGGNVYTSTAGNGMILKSPDGLTCRLVSIDNTGALVLTPIACP